MKNPFFFKELPVDAPFCNRRKEIRQLTSHAKNSANATLFSPRRYGKTSMVKRVQKILERQGYFTAYISFYGISSIDEIAALLATGLYEVSHQNEGLLKKVMRFITPWRPVIKPDPESGITVSVEATGGHRGLDLLKETLDGLTFFIEDHLVGSHLVLDEFQEIVDIPKSLAVEGMLRTYIQKHAKASYFFVGSRRRLLKDMMNEQKRPFYQSSINISLEALPLDESAAFIIERFKSVGVHCPQDIASRLVSRVQGYPYYIQRIPYSIYEVCGKKITESDYIRGFRQTIQEESTTYETMLKAIAPQQIALLKALAKDPTDSPFSNAYMTKHRLGSIGGIQSALRRLDVLDYIEQGGDKAYRVVDPVFTIWLQNSPF
ncbi:MAG TPA: hypothetical protein VK448_09840 [Dissulfurispiraceae bacterium]|nr:hypothetical protein [Dissulfurispiraceae bacterium]